MSQQARNNPDSPEMQCASRDNERAVFAAKMLACTSEDQRWRDWQDAKNERDLERGDNDEPTVASERSRWRDGVDNGNRDYI